MISQILSQFIPKIVDENYTTMLDQIREGFHLDFITLIETPHSCMSINEYPLRIEYKDNQLHDVIQKKLKKNNAEAAPKKVDSILGLDFCTDANYIPKLYKYDSAHISLKGRTIRRKLIHQQNDRINSNNRELSLMHRQLNMWFHAESLRRKEQQPQIDKQVISRRTIMTQSSQLIIKQDELNGIQVSGTIVTRQGYKLTYPNLAYIIKATDIPEPVTAVRVQRTLKPLNVADLDQLQDLSKYVWKVRQYKQFFRILLKICQGNVEISQLLSQVQSRMRTGFYHVMTFYHISNRSWSIPKIIKDLNKKSLFPREKLQIYEEMLVNINDDLDEIFSTLIEECPFMQSEEQFISFEQYRARLLEIILKRA